MAKKAKKESPILKAVHETAADLGKAGFIDKKRMGEYEALCLGPVPTYKRSRIRRLRHQSRLSQAVFAMVLNTSLSSVRQWEGGKKHPNGPSSKLLNILERKGLGALI